MITNGVQHALDLLLRLLVSPGQPVLVESPSYPNALVALAARRARVVTHNLAETGWDSELLMAGLRAARPRLAYLIPEYQNPTGHLMPGALRERLVAAAHMSGTDLVIDESFVDLPLDGQPVERPVAAFDRHARVLSIGSMSKPYWGGLRVGWIRAPAPVVARLAAVPGSAPVPIRPGRMWSPLPAGGATAAGRPDREGRPALSPGPRRRSPHAAYG